MFSLPLTERLPRVNLAIDEWYIEGFVEGPLERIGEDDPDEECLFRDLWLDETQRETVVEFLKADSEGSGREAFANPCQHSDRRARR